LPSEIKTIALKRLIDMAESIVIKDLSFTYAGEQSPALSHLNLTLPVKKVTLLLGPSGGGKSTLLWCLNGLIPNSVEGQISGEILYNNKNILGQPPKDLCRKMGVVYQDPESQFCTFTVEDEIVFGLENLNIDRATMAERLNYVLGLVGIENLRSAQLSNLSGGQKQKVAIAAVLALDPDVILLDEPTANLDPKSSAEIFELIRRLKVEYGKTIVLVEHKLDYLIDVIDYVAVLNKTGSSLWSGSPRQVFYQLLKDPGETSVFLPLISGLVWELGLPINKAEEVPLTLNEGLSLLKEKLKADQHAVKNFEREEQKTQDKSNLIEIRDVAYGVEGKQILKPLSLTIKRGDFLAIAGPNGAGKSTLLSIMMNLLPNYQGQVLLEGRDVKKLKARQLFEKMGLVFQNPELQYISNKVYDELAFSLENKTTAEKEKLIIKYLTLFGLEKYSGNSPFLLSQGQKRRLSVASMLIAGQEILLLDEPTYGQDHEHNVKLLQMMTQLNAQGVTIIVVTHDVDLIANYCNRVVVLKDGLLLFDGLPEDLFGNERLLNSASLFKPMIKNLSEKLQEIIPHFPSCTSEEEFKSAFREWMSYVL
jgi:energy-coupling factor transporter ATP-binding protein EcfA2